MYQVCCSSIQGIYAQLQGGSICHGHICIDLYICRSAIRCAKFGVAVFKASMVNCKGGSICHGYISIVLYI